MRIYMYVYMSTQHFQTRMYAITRNETGPAFALDLESDRLPP